MLVARSKGPNFINGFKKQEQREKNQQLKNSQKLWTLKSCSQQDLMGQFYNFIFCIEVEVKANYYVDLVVD